MTVQFRATITTVKTEKFQVNFSSMIWGYYI